MPCKPHQQIFFAAGTKYVLESRGPFVRRYIEFPNGNRIQLSTRRAMTCKCAERLISIVPEHDVEVLDAPALGQRIFA
jgi:hypothetical protein